MRSIPAFPTKALPDTVTPAGGPNRPARDPEYAIGSTTWEEPRLDKARLRDRLT